MSTLSSMAVRSWVDLLASDRPGAGVTRRTIEKEIERKRNEVAGGNPSPLERLLAERVALCWVAATHADAQYTRKLKDGMSFREGEYYGKRCAQTQRQSRKVMKSLARVRRLLTPMQIHIGQNQINLSKCSGVDGNWSAEKSLCLEPIEGVIRGSPQTTSPDKLERTRWGREENQADHFFCTAL